VFDINPCQSQPVVHTYGSSLRSTSIQPWVGYALLDVLSQCFPSTLEDKADAAVRTRRGPRRRRQPVYTGGIVELVG
jgi:hypothetical protein